jgi:hypothetical protein
MMPKMRSVPSFSTALLATFVLNGCSQSESDKADQQTRAALSWTAAAVMTLDAWRNETVPSHFARRTCRTVRQNILELAIDREQSGLRGRFQQEMRQISDTLGRAETGVAALDHPAVKRSRDALAASVSSLRASKAPR